MNEVGFVWQPLGTRVVFGSGTVARVPEEADRMGLSRLLVLTTEGRAPLGSHVLGLLGDRGIGLLPAARPHTPIHVTQAALARVAEYQPDGIVAVGGGSTIGLGKAIALRTDLPQIVIPTSYAGSEVTPILGETVHGIKETQRSPRVLPELVVYDVRLTLDLPIDFSVASAHNALAHAAEALYAPDSNPLITLIAETGVRSIMAALPRMTDAAIDQHARYEALYGAFLCGMCLGAVSMGLHHKLCHALGGAFDLPHAQMHAVLLPHVLAYNLSASPHARATLSKILGGSDVSSRLYALGRSLGGAMSLRELGMPENGIDQASELIMRETFSNPRPLRYEAVRATLTHAWIGEPPNDSLES